MGVVRSPCIDVCSLNEQDLCIGCWRSSEEITEWSVLSDAQKLEVLRKVGERIAANRGGS
jgi:uncharacterized protein